MSYDFAMRMFTGRDEHTIEYVCEPTYNLGPMFAEAFGHPIDNLRGMKGKDALPLIGAAVGRMLAEPATFRKLNPPNGWGDYEGAIESLKKLAESCDRHPEATVNV